MQSSSTTVEIPRTLYFLAPKGRSSSLRPSFLIKFMAAVSLAFMKKTWSADVARYAEVTRMLGYGDDSKTDEELAEYYNSALEKVLIKYCVNIINIYKFANNEL